MSSSPASNEPEPNRPPSGAEDDGNLTPAHDADFYCDILTEVMQTALGIARSIGRAISDNPATTNSDRAAAAIAVDRIARTIRRCILLIAKLQEGRPIRVTTARDRNRARAHVRAELQAAQTRAPPANDAEPETHAGSREPVERLDTLPAGTVPEIIAGFCQDLVAAAAPFTQPNRPTPAPTPEPHPPSFIPHPPNQTTNPPTQPPNPARAKGSG
jgi:hypothetical protein